MSRLCNIYTACKNGYLDAVKSCINARKCEINDDVAGDSPLLIACVHGRLDIVKFLLTIPECDVNFKNLFTGNTPLHIASRNGNEAIVQKLLNSKDCDVNCKNQAGDSPLHNASRRGYMGVLRLPNSKKCDVNCKNRAGYTPLHMASLNGHETIVQELLNSKECDVNCKNQTGDTPLHMASCKGYVDVVQKLINSKECDINCKNQGGDTPLHIASDMGCMHVVQNLLTSKECDVNCMNQAGRTPLHIAYQQGNIEIINLLIRVREKITLHAMIAHGKMPLRVADLQAIGYFVERNPYSINERDSKGNTVLHLAVQAKDRECVEKLLASTFCDPNVVNSEGDTPLHIASQQRSVEIVDLLVGSDMLHLHITNVHGTTPLHILFQMKYFAQISTLLEKCCSPSYVNREQIFQEAIDLAQVCEIGSLLHLACRYGSIGIAEFFLDSSFYTVAAVNKADVNGDTPLHIAARRSVISILKMLLACPGIDPNAENANGESALITACSRDCLECAQILTNYQDCDPNMQDNAGNTALHVAVQHDNSELVNILLYNSSCNPNISGLDGNTPLHLSVEKESIKCVKALLASSSCDPNIFNSEGNQPLHIAVQHGSVEVIDLILRTEKLNLSQPNSKGYFVLHLAVQTKNAICVEKLLTSPSCDPNVVNNEGDTPLHIACQQGSVEIIRLLLGCEKLSLHATNADGKTPLFILFQIKYFSLISILLGKSCSPNYVNREQIFQEATDLAQVCEISSPLHLACLYCSIRIVEFFLNSSYCTVAAVNKQDKNGDTPLHIAATSTLPAGGSIVQHLLACDCIDPNVRNGKGETALIAACHAKCFECAQILARFHQCNLNECNNAGSTALHIAVQNDNSKLISVLLQDSMKCNPHPIDNKGETPLQFAFKAKYFNIVQILLEKGTSPHYPNREQVIKDANRLTVGNLFFNVISWGNTAIAENLLSSDWYRRGSARVKNTRGNTLLHVSVTENQIGILKLLVDSPMPDLNLQNNNGETPLQVACRLNNLACISILACSASGVHKDANGDTLLHHAARAGDIDKINALLSNPLCDPNKCNTQGQTPLHVACRQRNLECVKLLANDKRCNVDKKSWFGDTALHVAIQGNPIGQIGIIKYLTQSVHCNPAIPNADGNTPLHLACNKGAWNSDSEVLAIVKLLLSTGKVDPECVNDIGRTAVEMASGNLQIIKELNSFADTKLKHPIQSYIKLFFIGNASVGKSTLVKAICEEASRLRKFALSSQYKQVTGVKLLTAGIVPLPFHSKHFGNAILYDFAGQHEYYSSHAAVLENLVLSSPPIFLLVFNLSQLTDHIREELAYWWSFIDSHCKKTSITPRVILIGSHKDILKSRGQKAKVIMAEIVKSLDDIPATFHVAGHVFLDCRNLVSNGLSELLTLLKKTCKKLRQNATVDLRCHVLYAFLTDKFHHRIACTVSEVQEAIRIGDTLLPQNPTDLEKLLSTLSDKDQILFLMRPGQCFKDSWIVLQRQKLLNEVNGSIFAPENFSEHIKDFAQSTGVVPLSSIKQNFPNYPSEVLTGSLCYLEYCFKIEDYQTIDIFTSESEHQEEIPEDEEEFYFFPALVQVDNPINVWKPNSKKPIQCGWFYECVHRYQFLTSRFLHVLILRLAFSFAFPVDHPSPECPVICRKCSIWKNGIAWWNRDGIETIVEIGLQRHWVVLMMRCAEDKQMACVQLRTAVIKSILDTRAEFCPTILMSESLISPSCVHYPFQNDNTALYSLKEVATAIITGKPDPYVTHDMHDVDPIQLTELIPFEPYSGLTEEILEKLFSDEHSENEVTDHDLSQIAEKAYQSLEVFKEAIKPNPLMWQSCREQAGSNKFQLCVCLLQVFRDRGFKTFKELQTQLSKFSIFCGRNPLEVAKVKRRTVQDVYLNSNSHSSSDDPQIGANSQSNSIAILRTESSHLQQLAEEVESTPLALLPSFSASVLSSDSTEIGNTIQPEFGATTGGSQLAEFENMDNIRLGISDLYMVNSSLMGVVLEWQDLGLSLGLSPSTLEVIKLEHSKIARRITETLAAWLQGQGSGIPSWRTLVMVLKSPAVGREDIALRITRELGSSPTDSIVQIYQEVDNTQLDTEDLADVRDEVLTLHNWFHLGLALGLSYHRLKGIEADNPQSIESCRTEALKAWLRKQDMVSERGQPSWRTLAQALSSPLVGKPEVANMFSTTHSIT